MAMSAIKPLPRVMLIRPEIAWNTIADEFADELAWLPPHEIATAELAFA